MVCFPKSGHILLMPIIMNEMLDEYEPGSYKSAIAVHNIIFTKSILLDISGTYFMKYM